MVAVVVLRGVGDATQMLLARRAGKYLNGIWSYIAGHVETGEAGWQTALRELHEETGLVPDSLWATSFCERFYALPSDSVELVPAFVARVTSTAEVHLNGEHSAFAWLSLEEAAERVPFGSQRELIAYVRGEFVQRDPPHCLRIPGGCVR